jgi:hypothetical protein
MDVRAISNSLNISHFGAAWQPGPGVPLQALETWWSRAECRLVV